MVLDDHYHEAQLWGYIPVCEPGKKVRNMASESVAETVTPTDVGLKRELGLIGATWASETSIIGSGWLFAPLTGCVSSLLFAGFHPPAVRRSGAGTMHKPQLRRF